MENIINVSSVRTDGGTQPRAAIFQNVVDDYAEAMKADAIFPPIVVFFDGTDYWLGDGFHRHAGAQKAGLAGITADVRQGTRRDAVLFSVGANALHGLRRTNEDKRRAVTVLLTDEEWREKGLNWMSKQAAVSVGFVHKLYHDLVSFHGEKIEKPAVRKVERGGTIYEQDTKNIGSKPEVRPSSEPALDNKDIVRAANAIKREEKNQKREDRTAAVQALAAIVAPESERYILYNEPCIKALSRPEQFDWVITDPPYPREFLPVYEDLARIAEEKLMPGGSLLCMVGQSYLPDIIRMLDDRLTYHWMVAYLTPGGQATQIFPRKVNTFWKPILWYTNGEYAGDWIGDATRSAANDNDKTRHHWGQSESGMHDLMKRFVKPGDRVLDPFMGAGTTGTVALDLGAHFTGYDIDQTFYTETLARLGNERMEQAG